MITPNAVSGTGFHAIGGISAAQHGQVNGLGQFLLVENCYLRQDICDRNE